MPRTSRRTKQNELLENELTEMNSFFSAEDLMSKIRKKDSSLGIATIYRFLKKKSDDGEIHVYNCKGKKIYSLGERNHSHFICKQCGKTSHFNIRDIGIIKNSVKGEICHFQLDVYGICKNCKQKNNMR